MFLLYKYDEISITLLTITFEPHLKYCNCVQMHRTQCHFYSCTT